MMNSLHRSLLLAFLLAVTVPITVQAADRDDPSTFENQEIADAAHRLFGATSTALAKAIQQIFAEHGSPNAYITAEETGGAIFGGIRYGQGTLNTRDGTRSPIYWRGASIGFDVGVSATKTFALIYNLDRVETLYQRFPGVAGNAYVIGGFSVTYYERDKVAVSLIRTGVGLRLGYNIGYVHFSPKPSDSFF